MTQPWEAERVVEPALALALIRDQFPDVAATRAEPFGQGWDNTMLLVDGDLLFRFPRREIAVRALAAEARVLPRIADAVPLDVPRPEWIGEPAPAFPWPFIGYRMLRGRTGCAVRLTKEQRMAVAEPLAQFVRALHDIDPGPVGPPPDELARADLAGKREVAIERLERVQAIGIVDDASPWIERFDEPIPTAPQARVLSHGDLYSRHILFDDETRPCAVIDWGDVHLGSPLVDLSLPFMLLPEPARARFFAVYGDVDDITLQLARLRGIWHAASELVYAHDVGDADLLTEARRSLEHLRT